jgi:Kef-type K+ transport system membrane component KefB
METAVFLRDLVVLSGIAVLVSYVFRILKLSSIPGFVVSGAVVGPYGLHP